MRRAVGYAIVQRRLETLQELAVEATTTSTTTAVAYPVYQYLPLRVVAVLAHFELPNGYKNSQQQQQQLSRKIFPPPSELWFRQFLIKQLGLALVVHN